MRQPRWSPALAEAVEELRLDNPMWGKRKIAVLLAREGFMTSVSTVGRKQLRDLHIAPLLGAERLSRLSAPRVEAFRDELLETRSKAMTSKVVRALSRILREAQRRGYVAQNVARDVKVVRSRRERARITIPTKSELKALIVHADDDFRPFVMTAIMTGLRSSELRGLQWDKVDLHAGTISVALRADKFCALGPPKSAAGFRTIRSLRKNKPWRLAAGQSLTPSS